MLFGVTASGPLIFAAAPATLTAAAAAGDLPARLASRIDPAAALRAA
jgi:ABC-type lipoprotein release transport system permease subunit